MMEYLSKLTVIVACLLIGFIGGRCGTDKAIDRLEAEQERRQLVQDSLRNERGLYADSLLTARARAKGADAAANAAHRRTSLLEAEATNLRNRLTHYENLTPTERALLADSALRTQPDLSILLGD